MTKARAAAAGLFCALAAHGTAVAQEPPAAAPDPDFSYDLRIDLPIIGAGGLGWILTETVFKPALAPSACRWCDRAGATDQLNPLDAGVRNALLWSDPGGPGTLSNITGFGLAPASALGMIALAAFLDGKIDRFPVDALLIAEAAVLSADLNQTVKFIAGRARPFTHACGLTTDCERAPETDDNVSFYSGHTSFTFSLAVAAGTVASLRGYKWAPVVWGAGLAIAATTGWARMAADKHYFTDVMTGALIGAAIGFAIPYLFHRR
jgi:membrane-associated phospholipid phosphatase